MCWWCCRHRHYHHCCCHHRCHFGYRSGNVNLCSSRILTTLFLVQDSSCENVIQRDINRTFPAHDFFKEAGGLGQDSLYRISKAYAVHDSEVGYCQGLSFLAATLLLHVSTMCNGGWDSIIGIVMLQTGQPSVWTPMGAKDFLFCMSIQAGPEAHPSSCQWVLGLFSRNKAAGTWRWSPTRI